MSKRVTFASKSDLVMFYDFSPVDVKSKVIIQKPVPKLPDKVRQTKEEKEKCCSRMVRLLFGPKM